MTGLKEKIQNQFLNRVLCFTVTMAQEPECAWVAVQVRAWTLHVAPCHFTSNAALLLFPCHPQLSSFAVLYSSAMTFLPQNSQLWTEPSENMSQMNLSLFKWWVQVNLTNVRGNNSFKMNGYIFDCYNVLIVTMILRTRDTECSEMIMHSPGKKQWLFYVCPVIQVSYQSFIKMKKL